MKFGEKLARLTADRRVAKTQVSQDAGLPPNAISDYISKGYIPRADTALRIARVLGVTLDFLIDETQTYPPPSSPDSAPSLPQVGTSELMHELARRYRLAVLDFLDTLKQAKSLDWQRAATEAAATASDAPLPTYARRAWDLMFAVTLKFDRLCQEFDVEQFAMLHHERLPGGDRPIEQMEYVRRRFIWNDVEDIPAFQRFNELAAARPDYYASPERQQHQAYVDRAIEAAKLGKSGR